MTDEVMLDKIRALLAKAEATNFPEEARAFFEGAQRLMVQHSINEAMLRKTTDTGTPTVKKVTIVAPYIKSKGCLLNVVASANNCFLVAPYKTRGGDGTGTYTLFGYANAIQTTEMLFTSLLVQMLSVRGNADAFNAGKQAGSRATLNQNAVSNSRLALGK